MSADKKWRLICYDIRDPKRYRKVFKILRGTGHSVQYSIFRCRLDDREAEKLRWRLAKVMDAVDSLLIVDLCPGCASKVISRNHVDGWTEVPATHRIFSSRQNHASARGDLERLEDAANSATPQQVPPKGRGTQS
jgi:CRISPR-associated protein Cas2